MLKFLITAIALFTLFTGANAQQLGAVRIGVITLGVPKGSPFLEAFRQGLRDHGYAEGRNLLFEYRLAQGHIDRLPSMAAEIVRLKVDVIVTESTPAVLAVSKATKTI